MKTRSLALAFTAAVCVAVPQSAHASTTYAVTGGKLEWKMANHYASGDPARTFLGYVTSPFSAGTAATAAPAWTTDAGGARTGMLDTTSTRDVDYTFGYPVDRGSYATDGTGTIDALGTVTFTTHGMALTLVDPEIKLSGLTGTLTATGVTAAGAAYDRSKVQYTLDLSKATLTTRSDGARVIGGIVPASTADSATSGFPAGSTLFGTFSLTLDTVTDDATTPYGDAIAGGDDGTPIIPADGKDGAQGPAGPAGAAGPAGPSGPRGATGKAGKSAKISTFKLARAPFAGSATRSVKLLQRRTGKILAAGTLKGRTLRVSHVSGTKLKGSYVLKSGTHRAVISIK